jgi:hypothetical protein
LAALIALSRNHGSIDLEVQYPRKSTLHFDALLRHWRVSQSKNHPIEVALQRIVKWRKSVVKRDQTYVALELVATRSCGIALRLAFNALARGNILCRVSPSPRKSAAAEM